MGLEAGSVSLKLWKGAEEDLRKKTWIPSCCIHKLFDSPRGLFCGERTQTHQILSIFKDGLFTVFCKLYLQRYKVASVKIRCR